MNLLISLHSIFQDEESLEREEEVEAAGLEEDIYAVGLEDTSDRRGHDFEEEEDEEEEGHEEGEEEHEDGVGMYDEGVGVMGLLQDPHPHAKFGVAISFVLL
jgi:hypothetical protein